ncbi:MAG TPA: ATP-binding protein, partial [Caldilineaceae bacterium]|nr:ATP-binding protein [Caldilineaceae bacterium]
MQFVGRAFELDYLHRLYTEVRGTLCIVYGRRRIGKTRLLTQWLESSQTPGFYWLATDTSAAALLASLSQAIYRQMHGEPPAQPGFSYYDWDELFRELVRMVRSSAEKVVVILDEFTYAVEAYPDLPHKLQAVWDHELKDLPVMLVLSGSHIGMVEESLLAHRSPLFGRATGVLNLRQLPFKDVRAGFPRYDIEACIALYSVVGGVPYYLEQLDPSLSVVENIMQRVMASPALVQDEPRLLLHDHFAQPRLYAAIIALVARGIHSPKEIADTLDVEAATVGGYLNTLVRLGLVQREVPATERRPEQSRRSRYQVTDPFLR